MKITELEVGKEYSVWGYEDKMKIDKDGFLFFFSNSTKTWTNVGLAYNDVLKMDFTEYEEPVDWSKIEVDTKIMVKEHSKSEWYKRHFAKYENETIFAWSNSATSWTGSSMSTWKEARFPTEEELK